MKYSLWLIPPEPIFTKLQQIINDKSLENHTPSFEPHLTLLSNIETDLNDLINSCNNFFSLEKPISLSLSEVSFSTTYFQAVFVRVKANAQLMSLNLKLKKALGLIENVYMPHISLCYDDSFSMENREKMVNEINLTSDEFIVGEVVIVPSVPNPNDWHHLAKISLGEKPLS